MRPSLVLIALSALFSLSAAQGLGSQSSELTSSSSLEKRGTCVPSKCHNKITPYSHRVCKENRCTSACNKGYQAVHGKCVVKTCKVSACKQAIPAHSHRICNKKKACAFACNAGFRWNGHACVRGVSTCKASLCKNSIPLHSRRICKNGECNFGCNTGYHRAGNVCKKDATTCTASSQCTRHLPANALKACRNGLCGFSCKNGFKKSADGKSCVVNAGTCGTKTCKALSNGAVDCVHGKCVYTCDTGAGYRRFVVGGVVKCLKLYKDPENCGSIGNGCAGDYLGLGKPSCSQGHCTLKCPSPTRPHIEPNSPAYCS